VQLGGVIPKAGGDGDGREQHLGGSILGRGSPGDGADEIEPS
jgi:hypothetical protein